jgi:hypothetical protein
MKLRVLSEDYNEVKEKLYNPARNLSIEYILGADNREACLIKGAEETFKSSKSPGGYVSRKASWVTPVSERSYFRYPMPKGLCSAYLNP